MSVVHRAAGSRQAVTAYGSSYGLTASANKASATNGCRPAYSRAMASRSKRRARFLRRALKLHDCIRVERRSRRADRIEGYVIGIGRRWVRFAVPTDGSPDGFVALRIRDLKRAYWASGGRFLQRSLQAKSAWPPATPDHPVDLDHGVKRLEASAAVGSALVTIHPELDDTDVCYIGRPPSAGGATRYTSTKSTRRAAGRRRLTHTASRPAPESTSAGCTKRIWRSLLGSSQAM